MTRPAALTLLDWLAPNTIVLADKAYDGNVIRDLIEAQGAREVPAIVGLRFFLPESWTDDAERMTRARVPLDRQQALTKPEIAIEEIDRAIASGARFGCVLAEPDMAQAAPSARR